MKKIGFVTPWFGMDIPGGAEAELRGLALHIKAAGHDLEILTTCVEKFTSDWNRNYHKPGLTTEGGINVRRFKARERDTSRFNEVNYKLMTNQLPLSDEEEKIFADEMVNSPDLYEYIGKNLGEYSIFVFIPYMFGTTYFGMQAAPKKSVLIPCLHDESYIHMRIFRELFPKIGGMIFLAKPEYELAQKEYDLSDVKTAVLGAGVETDLTCNGQKFRQKYGIDRQFILYAGRKDSGKNVDVLVRYFNEYHKRNVSDLQLVLIGGGSMEIPESCREKVHDLGFVDIQDKYDAYAAAELLCQPSQNESFSLVIMESWLCGRPVLVNDACAVTKNFAIESNGGLYFKDYFEFEGAVGYMVAHKDIASAMGKNGREYVRKNFAWDRVVDKYLRFFQEIERGRG